MINELTEAQLLIHETLLLLDFKLAEVKYNIAYYTHNTIDFEEIIVFYDGSFFVKDINKNNLYDDSYSSINELINDKPMLFRNYKINKLKQIIKKHVE